MRKFKITNISGQKLMLTLELSNGDTVIDYIEIDEVCYDINESAALMLKAYASIGLLKIESEGEHLGVNWLSSGF